MIHTGSLERASVDALLDLVGEALDSLAEDDARYPQLAKIEEELLEGRIPARRLQKFAEKFGPDPLELLDADLRRRAEQLPISAWQTPVYRRLQRALETWRQGSKTELEEFCQRQSVLLQEAEEEFESDLESEEVPVLVGQRLLLQGVRGWKSVLQQVCAASRAEECQHALAAAEQANRIIAAVCQLEERYPHLLE